MARGRRTALPIVLAAVTLTSVGCDSTMLLSSGHSSTSTARQSAGPVAHAGRPPAAQAVTVIKGWADALRRGDVVAAARYFKIPSVLVDGSGPALTIRSLAQAEAANASLSCGARFISATQRGPFVNVLFRLTGRPGRGGGSCTPGAGQTARTDFVIKAGRITVWLRAPDEPGDNGSPGPRPGPATTPAPGPTI